MSIMTDDQEQAEFISKFSAPPSTKTQEEVMQLIADNQGTINELHVMYCLFEMTAIRRSQVRARASRSTTGGLPPRLFDHVQGICEEAANAIVSQDVGYFSRKFEYKQYVLTCESKNHTPHWMGPFHTPAITISTSGRPKAYPTLKEALIHSTTVYKSK